MRRFGATCTSFFVANRRPNSGAQCGRIPCVARWHLFGTFERGTSLTRGTIGADWRYAIILATVITSGSCDFMTCEWGISAHSLHITTC